jgi:hypothetical protein
MPDELTMTEEISDKVIGERSLAAWEIASVSLSFLISEWVAFSWAGNSKLIAAVPVAAAFGFMLASHRLHGETIRDVGLRFDNFARASWLLTPPTVAAIAVFLLVGWLANGWQLEKLLARPRYLLLPVWALAQQYVTQGFINRRAQIVFGKGWRSVVVVASIFALLHMPNLNLVALTFIGAAVWATVYQITPNLFALALSHTIAAMVLAKSLPSAWLNGLRVGLKYFL